ncbi:MAG: M15 family metallopeptidase [Agromyces sp.]
MSQQRHAKRSAPRLVAWILAGVCVLLLSGGAVAWAAMHPELFSARAVPTSTPTPTKPATHRPTPTATPTPTPTWNVDDPNSLTVVVNKLRPLTPQDFTPSDLRDVNVPHTWQPRLRAEAATAVETMFAAAQSEAGLALASNSAYRSFTAQQNIYHGDDRSTARPGFSEHQTGLAMDIGAVSGKCSLNACFADTPEGQWLATNAWRFGFVLRYPNGQDAITGYEFEPWHYRYIGVSAAKRFHDTKAVTLEGFLGLPAAPDYLAPAG